MNTIALHSLERGQKENPAVVCIHGLLGSSRNLLRLADGVANTGFHVVAYDQRGHGHSDHSSDYGLQTMARDVFQIMDEKQITHAHLIGHSLGARVALAATHQNPARVKSLTMLDAGVQISAVALQEVKMVTDPLPEAFADKEEADQFLNRFQLGLKNFLLSNLRMKGDRFAWNFDLAGIRSELLSRITEDQTEAWKKVTCPTLLVKGGISGHFSRAELDHMLALNPKAQSAIIPRAGHWVHVDNFDDCLTAISRFLASHP